jgi:HEAT repeats/Putative zinc-finger
MDCKEFEENLTLYSYGELPKDDRAAADAHLGTCSGCRGRLDETRRMHELLNARSSVEPSPELLAQCRMALEDALDRELASVSWKKLFSELWTGLSVFPLTRASAILALLLLGFGLGWTLRPHAMGSLAGGGATGANQASALEPDMSNMRINAITQVTPSSSADGQVSITLDAERRMTLQGSLDDPRIRQVLVDAVKSYSNAGIRRDSLDALQGGGAHPSVRGALLYAIQNDSNSGVRLEALKAVRTMEWAPDVQQAVLRALAPENNPGVRVAAIDTLVDHADDSTLPVLERMAATDSNRYVRLKSLSAIRKIEGNRD